MTPIPAAMLDSFLLPLTSPSPPKVAPPPPTIVANLHLPPPSHFQAQVQDGCGNYSVKRSSTASWRSSPMITDSPSEVEEAGGRPAGFGFHSEGYLSLCQRDMAN